MSRWDGAHVHVEVSGLDWSGEPIESVLLCNPSTCKACKAGRQAGETRRKNLVK